MAAGHVRAHPSRPGRHRARRPRPTAPPPPRAAPRRAPAAAWARWPRRRWPRVRRARSSATATAQAARAIALRAPTFAYAAGPAAARHEHGGDQLVVAQVAGVGPGQERRHRQAPHAGGRGQLHLGAGRDQRGEDVGGRVGDRERPAQRRAVADLPRGDRAGGQRQHRQALGQLLELARVGDARPEPDRITVLATALSSAHAGQIEQRTGSLAAVAARHHLRAARDDDRLGEVTPGAKRLAHRPWLDDARSDRLTLPDAGARG